MLLKKKLGFTLVELMVVIVIIGILAALAIPRLMGFQDKAKAKDAETIIKSFEGAYLVAAGEVTAAVITDADLEFSATEVTNSSQWFDFAYDNASDIKGLSAVPVRDLGDLKGKATGGGSIVWTRYTATDGFKREAAPDVKNAWLKLSPAFGNSIQ